MRPGWAAALAATALVAACSRVPEPPGTLSVEDEQRLNAVAEALDANTAGSVDTETTNDADADD